MVSFLDLGELTADFLSERIPQCKCDLPMCVSLSFLLTLPTFLFPAPLCIITFFYPLELGCVRSHS